MPYCRCGAHVSQEWKRVVAVDGEILTCPNCHAVSGSADPLRNG